MQKIIIANWKCKPETAKEVKDLFNEISEGLKNITKAKIVICPPFYYLSEINNKYNLSLGGQNCFVEKKDVDNQNISWRTAKDQGCEFAIVGHSSRRIFLGQTDESINQELKEIFSFGLIPIFCIGETKEQKQASQTESILESQIKKGLAGLSIDEISKIIIAYEPIWAISDGNPYNTKEMPTTEGIKKVSDFIKSLVLKNYSGLDNVTVIYGGSANSANAKAFLEEAGMDGLLIGGASLKAEEFIKIVNAV